MKADVSGPRSEPILLLAAFRVATDGAVALLLTFEIVATAVLGVVLFHGPWGAGRRL